MFLTSSLHKDSTTAHVCWVLPNPSPGSSSSWGFRPTPLVAQRTSLPQQLRDTSDSMLPQPSAWNFSTKLFLSQYYLSKRLGLSSIQSPKSECRFLPYTVPSFQPPWSFITHSFIHSFKNTYCFRLDTVLDADKTVKYNCCPHGLNQSLNIVALCVCPVMSNSLQPLGL